MNTKKRYRPRGQDQMRTHCLNQDSGLGEGTPIPHSLIGYVYLNRFLKYFEIVLNKF